MEFVTKRKKKRGDRNDGHLLRKAPVINKLMAGLYPNRCENEVSAKKDLDITELLKFIKTKNEEDPLKNLKFFHCFIAIVTRIINERRKLLCFIKNGNFYEKDEIKISFVAKRGFSDKAEEAVISYYAKGEDNVYSVSQFITGQVKDARDEKKIEEKKQRSDSTEGLEKLPPFIFKMMIKFLRWADKHGCIPKDASEEDPSFSTVLVANLGSIKSSSVYHHLNNYGNCSFMITIGSMFKKEIINENGEKEIRDFVDITATFDERIADGFYFIKTVNLMQDYMNHPETLELKFCEDSGLKA